MEVCGIIKLIIIAEFHCSYA